jgi:hypothetical protein
MLTTSNQGKALLATLRNMKIGEAMKLNSPIPAIPDECQAFLMERDGDYWRLELYWMGIAFGEVVAEVTENQITLEQL